MLLQPRHKVTGTRSARVRDHPLLTPAMLVYLAFTLLVTIVVAVVASPISLVNVVLFGAYVALITFMTRHEQPVMASAVATTRRRDLALAGAVALVVVIGAIFFWTAPAMSGYHAIAALFARSVPSQLAAKAANAALATVLLLLPTAVLLLIFRPRPTALGLRPRHLGLGLLLAAFGVALAVSAVMAHAPIDIMLWQRFPAGLLLALIALQSLVNAIPEELAFRGVITSRLLPWLGRPGNTLVVSSVVFALFHVPANIGSGLPLGYAIFGVFIQPTGLTWAYLWYRTGSIWPGAIWHLSVSGLGVMYA